MKTRPTISTMSAAELAMHYQLLDDLSISMLDPRTGTAVEVTSIRIDLFDSWIITITTAEATDHLKFRSTEQVVVAIG